MKPNTLESRPSWALRGVVAAVVLGIIALNLFSLSRDGLQLGRWVVGAHDQTWRAYSVMVCIALVASTVSGGLMRIVGVLSTAPIYTVALTKLIAMVFLGFATAFSGDILRIAFLDSLIVATLLAYVSLAVGIGAKAIGGVLLVTAIGLLPLAYSFASMILEP